MDLLYWVSRLETFKLVLNQSCYRKEDKDLGFALGTLIFNNLILLQLLCTKFMVFNDTSLHPRRVFSQLESALSIGLLRGETSFYYGIGGGR